MLYTLQCYSCISCDILDIFVQERDYDWLYRFISTVIVSIDYIDIVYLYILDWPLSTRSCKCFYVFWQVLISSYVYFFLSNREKDETHTHKNKVVIFGFWLKWRNQDKRIFFSSINEKVLLDCKDNVLLEYERRGSSRVWTKRFFSTARIML